MSIDIFEDYLRNYIFSFSWMMVGKVSCKVYVIMAKNIQHSNLEYCGMVHQQSNEQIDEQTEKYGNLHDTFCKVLDFG